MRPIEALKSHPNDAEREPPSARELASEEPSGRWKKLQAELRGLAGKAIGDYRMIEDGDRVMVGLSGGKDSWALIQVLDVLRKRAPISFSLVAVTVDSGYNGYRHDLDRKSVV